MTGEERKRELLRDLLTEAGRAGAYPQVERFRIAHERDRRLLDQLAEARLMEADMGRYVLTLDGLRACETEQARTELNTAARLVSLLQEHHRRSPGETLTSSALASKSGKAEVEVRRALTHLRSLPVWESLRRDKETGLVYRALLTEAILDVSPSDVAPSDLEGTSGEPPGMDARLVAIEIDGYRPFRQFTAEPGDLTVIIGANATGKSSLFDFLRFVHRSATDPLPPEIDQGAVGKTLFHAGGAERIRFALGLDLRQRALLRYEAEILGPVGAPRVARERLATTRPLGGEHQEAFVFLDFTGGRGVVRSQREKRFVRPEWAVAPNELALRRALDPTLATLSRVQGWLSSWRFFSGFDVSAAAAVRRPAPIEPEPVLREDGGNLSAVLMWLNREHQAAWEELESHLRLAVPGFRSLNVKPRGGPGTAIGVWSESAVSAELTLADLSDGTLRFLCWSVLCLSPRLPPLLCIDEPELGLHPRVLPILAGLLRLASARAQILVATHSPYFLAQFALDEIAVMRKEDGAARFVRPASSKALREMVREVGGEALARLHISDELEILP